METFSASILLIPLVAVAAPIIARGLGRWVRIPLVVFELGLGILIGPSVLGWADPHDLLSALSDFGLAILFFVAGSEIQYTAFRGRLGRRAGGGWLISLAVGVAVGWIIAPGETAVVIGVALASTALGTLLPILRDDGELRTPFGGAVAAVGAVGEFGPLVAISLFLGGRDPGLATVVLIGFVVVAGAAIWAAAVIPSGALHQLVNATLHTSGQFAIRVVVVILAALVGLSVLLDLDMLLGAFTAGIIWRLIMSDAAPKDQEAVESKIEAFAFGFFVPIFFIYTGVTFDLDALTADPRLLWLVPVGALVLLVVRGIPSMLAAPKGSSVRDTLALGFLGATGLPIIVAVTAIGVDEGLLPSGIASALVGAGMLSVLLYPLIGMALRRDPINAPATLGADEG